MSKKLPKIITIEEYRKLLHENATRKKPHWHEYGLAMALGFEAGLRISEIVGWKDRVPALTKDKLDFAGNHIRIESGKGQKDRIVPLPKSIKPKHTSLLPLKLSRRSLQHYVTRLGKDVLGKEISFHTLRHGFGSHLAGANRPLHEIQMLMGHSRLDTTGVYLHANPKKALEGARELF
jgi:site-specific recombinase XerD